jgi:hypothetical protein
MLSRLVPCLQGCELESGRKGGAVVNLICSFKLFRTPAIHFSASHRIHPRIWMKKMNGETKRNLNKEESFSPRDIATPRETRRKIVDKTRVVARWGKARERRTLRIHNEDSRSGARINEGKRLANKWHPQYSRRCPHSSLLFYASEISGYTIR